MPAVILARDGPGSVAATFPWSADVTAIMREIPGREFKDTRRVWIFPLTPENVLQLWNRLKPLQDWKLIIPLDVRSELRATANAITEGAAIKAKGDADLEFDYHTEPYAHQRAGLAFLARLGSGALLWEMGLGKTKTAIDYAEWLCEQETISTPAGPAKPWQVGESGSRRVLVIAPKTVCRNWIAEIEMHAGHSDYVYLADGAIAKRIPQLGSARYTIVNCEAVSLAPFAAALQAIEWDLVIVDESTRFKTPKAARTKALHKLRRKRSVILTGTPITGKPQDAWSQFHFLAPGIMGKTYWAFEQRYVQKDWFGNVVGLKAETADELVRVIDTRGYRILKSDVLDLPPKVYLERRVTLEGDQAKAYAQMRDELRVEIEGNPKLTASSILTMLLRLTQITAGLIGSNEDGYRWLPDSAKLKELDILVNEDLVSEQLVIFAQYQAELQELAERYGPPTNRPAIIYGPTPDSRRRTLIEQFQEGKLRILFAQARTGGIGINLTAAKTAIYYTRSWSLEEYLQSQDRLHRIGQTGTVSIINLLAEGTIDDDIAKAIAEKQELADHLTGDSARKLAAQVLGGH